MEIWSTGGRTLTLFARLGDGFGLFTAGVAFLQRQRTRALVVGRVAVRPRALGVATTW